MKATESSLETWKIKGLNLGESMIIGEKEPINYRIQKISWREETS